MAGQSHAVTEAKASKGAPQTVAPITRITVAFPFSHISTGGPSQEFEEVNGLLQEMADLLATAVPGQQAEDLRARVHQMAARAA